jgi:hypothetical protein
MVSPSSVRVLLVLVSPSGPDIWFAETYLYFSRFPKDNVWIKLTVSVGIIRNLFIY